MLSLTWHISVNAHRGQVALWKRAKELEKLEELEEGVEVCEMLSSDQERLLNQKLTAAVDLWLRPA